MEIKYHVLRDLQQPKDLGADEYRRTVADRDMLRNRIAFDSLLYLPGRKKLFLGLMAYDNDILYSFDPQSAEFESLNYPRVAEKYEIKLHRSLNYDGGKFIYGGTSALHDASLYLDGPGGRVFRYDLETKEIEMLGIPSPHDYIQTITLDAERGIVYGLLYPVFKFFKLDIATREIRDFGYIGSITHISALDQKGRFWGTWHWRYHHFFCYDPDADKILFHDRGMDWEQGGPMYPGAGPVDAMINGEDGFIYLGTTSGVLARLDPEQVTFEYLGKPYPGRRMPALRLGEDGRIYGCGGDDGRTYIFAYDRGTRSFEVLCRIRADDGIGCFRTHDMAMIGTNRFFVGETDNPTRAGYLWECTL